MSGIVKLDKKGLAELIDSIKANEGDTTELDNMMAEIIEDENAQRPVRRREADLTVLVEEPTTEERLEAEVGGLFPRGITGEILAEVIEFDRNHTLAEIKKMAVEAGFSPSGHKKELAAKLIAKGIR
ncbi:hypothetical protein ES703_07734 [subsurface metagenome]